MKDSIRGLGTFIMDIRLCNFHSFSFHSLQVNQERLRLNASTRSSPTLETNFAVLSFSLLFNYLLADKNIDGYDKKKYVAKLIFIFLLGYEINIGHMEAIMLLSSLKFSEKQIVIYLLFLLYL